MCNFSENANKLRNDALHRVYVNCSNCSFCDCPCLIFGIRGRGIPVGLGGSSKSVASMSLGARLLNASRVHCLTRGALRMPALVSI